MQRASWAGNRNVDGDRSQSLSKMPKLHPGFGRSSQRRIRGGKLVWLCLFFGALLLLWWAYGHAKQNQLVSSRKYSRKEAEVFRKQINTLITKTSLERKSRLSTLQKLFQDWQLAKDALKSYEDKVRIAKAEMQSMEDLHDQRMKRESGKDADTERRKREYEEEYSGAKAKYEKLLMEGKELRSREDGSRNSVEVMRLQIQAYGLALAEFNKRKHETDASPVKGSRQPGNQYDEGLLMKSFSQGLSKTFDQDLSGAQEIRSKRQLEERAILNGTNTSQKDPIRKAGGSRAMLPHDISHDNNHVNQVVEKISSALQEHKEAIAGAQDTTEPIKGTAEISGEKEKAVSEETKVEDKGSSPKRPWLSEHWKGRGNGIIGQHDVDKSLRCQKSGLCEGIDSCKIGQKEVLGCLKTTEKRLEAVREATSWSWEGYKRFAYGKDELKPVSGSYETWFELGLTLVDSLDTFLLLGMDAEYEEAKKWVAFDLKLDPDKSVNLFETTIRIVGGLLAAFHLSHGDKTMLFKATSLALRLLPAFDAPRDIPFSDVNLRTHKADPPHWTTYSSLSEVTSLTMEFSYIARAAGEPELGEKALKTVYTVLESLDRVDGLAPIYVDTNTAKLHSQVITLGARGDSYYEYLLKQWLLSGKKDDKLLNGYLESMRGVRKHMLMRTDHDGLLFVAEAIRSIQLEKSPKMDHLVCFLPGLLALGHYHGLNSALPGEPNDLEIAEDLMRTCYEMYRRTPTGLAPELAFFNTAEAAHDGSGKGGIGDVGDGDFVIKEQDSHNLLRPETVESLFILKSVTEKPHYQEWAWEIFRAFHMHSRVQQGGFANLESCLSVPPLKRDKMESFWLAETLKYIYLTLDDSSPPLIDLNEVVFNTEAHPLPVAGSHTDVLLSDFYLANPYQSLANTTLDTRIQFWDRMAADEAGRQAQLVS